MYVLTLLYVKKIPFFIHESSLRVSLKPGLILIFRDVRRSSRESGRKGRLGPLEDASRRGQDLKLVLPPHTCTPCHKRGRGTQGRTTRLWSWKGLLSSLTLAQIPLSWPTQLVLPMSLKNCSRFYSFDSETCASFVKGGSTRDRGPSDSLVRSVVRDNVQQD